MYLVSRLEKEILVVWLVDCPIFVTVKKSQSDIFSAGISQSTIISWPLVVKTQKSQGVVVVLLRREWCPVFSDSVHLYHSDPSSRLLTERRILCLHLIKKVFKSRRRRYNPACANLSCQAFLAWDRFRSVIHWHLKEISYSHSIFQWVTPVCTTVGIQLRNMKMDLNIYGTWRQVTFEKLMMKI